MKYILKVYIAQLGASETNDGRLQILPAEFANNDDGPKARSCRYLIIRFLSYDQYDDSGDDAYYLRMGLIMVNLTNPMQEVNMITSPMLWSRPVPLGNFLIGHY